MRTYARLSDNGTPFAYGRYSIVNVLSSLRALGHPVDVHLHEVCPKHHAACMGKAALGLIKMYDVGSTTAQACTSSSAAQARRHTSFMR